jgi:hypothetical protein
MGKEGLSILVGDYLGEILFEALSKKQDPRGSKDVMSL